MMRQSEQVRRELVVVTKAYDFTLWLLPHTAQFSRAHRHTLGTRLEETALEILETLVEAGYSRDKRDLLERANRRLERLRYLLRLAKDLKLMNLGQYEFSARALVDIGSEVGGWLKQQKAAPQTPAVSLMPPFGDDPAADKAVITA